MLKKYTRNRAGAKLAAGKKKQSDKLCIKVKCKLLCYTLEEKKGNDLATTNEMQINIKTYSPITNTEKAYM